MRTIVPHLLAIALGAAGCAALARSGAGFGPEARPRWFYLTKATFQGNKVLDACARGFHMASARTPAAPRSWPAMRRALPPDA